MPDLYQNHLIYRDYFLEGRNRFQVKDLVIESTKNTHSYAIPNFTPFQSINFVASRAVSENHDSKGSFYLFYETLSRGFRCDSVETLMKKEASFRLTMWELVTIMSKDKVNKSLADDVSKLYKKNVTNFMRDAVKAVKGMK